MNTNGFEIDFLPVGDNKKSGDCICFRYGNLEKGGSSQTVVVVDGGYAKTAQALKDHLQKYYNCTDDNGVTHIDLMILSHPDADHVGGLTELSKDTDIDIRMIMMHRPWEELSPAWFKDGRITPNSLKNRLEDAFSKAVELDENTESADRANTVPGKYEFNSASFYILGPRAYFYKQCIASCEKTPDQKEEMVLFTNSAKPNSDLQYEYYFKGKMKWPEGETTSAINESSIILLFEYNGVKILLTGDAGQEGLRRAVMKANDLGINLHDIDMIKMPHHGSRKNVNPQLMDNFSGSKYCVFSCVKDDVGHHPSLRLTNMLLEKGFEVYSTSGKILHWGKNAPKRDGYKTAVKATTSYKIEK